VVGLALGGGRKVPAALVSGFLVDFDHVVDYFFGRGKRIVLPLHGWDLLPLWWIADRRLQLGGALVVAYAAHMAMDQIWNEKRTPFGYFLAYRASKGFREEEVGAVDPGQRHVWRRSSLLGLVRWF
jgi:hypothetical protein